MTRLRMYFALALTVAAVALAGFAAPSAEAAVATVRCESTGGGTFFCSTTASGRYYYWTGGSNATITDNQGKVAYGTCKIGTKPTVTVTASYYIPGGSVSVTWPQPVTVSTSFTCSSVAL
jgi:hypothetical protein